MDLESAIREYLDREGMTLRTTQQVYDAVLEHRNKKYVQQIQETLRRRAQGEITVEAFYTAMAEEVGEMSVYDLFASRARKGLAWNIRRIAEEMPEGSQILDAGCGTGIISEFLARYFPQKSFTGIDCSSGMITAAQKRAARLNLPNLKYIREDLFTHRGTYDCVIVAHALDDARTEKEDDSKEIGFLRELLNEQGKLILLRNGGIQEGGAAYEGEVCNSDFRECILLGIPPETLFCYNDSDGDGLSHGLTVWDKK